jgi:hypothetical protein
MRQYVTTGARNATMIILRLSAGIARRLSFEAEMTLVSNPALDMLGKKTGYMRKVVSRLGVIVRCPETAFA